MVVVKTHHRATGIDRKGVRMSLPASGRWVPASDKGYAPQCHPREILLGCASWVLTISLPTHGYCYTYTYYTYINKYCIHIYCIYTAYIIYIYIRRPRQTQGGAHRGREVVNTTATTTTTTRWRTSTSTKMRQKDVWYGKMVTSCGIKRTSHCALLLRARAEHMNTTMHNPYGIAGVRSSIEYSKVFKII